MKKEPIDIEFAEQKADPYNDENVFDLNNQKYKKKTRKILFWLTSLKITKASWLGNFFTKVAGWLFDDCGILPNQKN